MVSATDEVISYLSTKLILENSKNTLKLKDEITPVESKPLHNKFVVATHNDKASDKFCLCPSKTLCSSSDQWNWSE